MNLSFSKMNILIMAIVAMVMIFGFEPIGVNTAQADTIIISGKIIQVQDVAQVTPWGRRKVILHVKTAKGNIYQIHTGFKTSYVPHRTPMTGDKVSCEVIKNRGVWAAYTVTYK
jgi:hypothetical protein